VAAVVFAAEQPLVQLEERGLLLPESTRFLAANQLVLVAAPGRSALSWQDLAQLGEDERFSMGEPGSVPAGAYARAALEGLGLWADSRDHAVFSKDVSAALALARRREVVGAIVYATDLRGSESLSGVRAADWDGAPRPGVYGGLARPAHRGAADLLEFLASGAAASIWERHGFAPGTGLLAPGSLPASVLSAGPVEDDAGFPIVLSLKIALLALLLVGPPGIALAWLQARHRYPLRGVVDALVLLPLVLPPSVVGYFLVVVLGTQGALGGLLDQAFATRIIFSPTAAVIASAVVALPLLVKTAQPAIEAVSQELELVGSSLGLGPLALFFRVTLPLAWRGILAGLVLAWARGLGEFGATLMFAGHIPGRTNTMPLEIYAAYQRGDEGSAMLYVAVLSALSFGVVLIASRFAPGREA
jgi:molybdate transport system permease protein